MNECFRITDSAVCIDIKAVPGASKTEFAGVRDKRLRVRIAAAPEDGKANGELVSFMAKALGCPKRDVQLIRGEKSRLKTIAVPGRYAEKLDEILN
jgi:uncharacterized protein (TIGR00251 family)